MQQAVTSAQQASEKLKQQVMERAKARIKNDPGPVNRPLIAPDLAKLPTFTAQIQFDADTPIIQPDSYQTVGRLADALGRAYGSSPGIGGCCRMQVLASAPRRLIPRVGARALHVRGSLVNRGDWSRDSRSTSRRHHN